MLPEMGGSSCIRKSRRFRFAAHPAESRRRDRDVRRRLRMGAMKTGAATEGGLPLAAVLAASPA
jgi:hypothetical protein